MDKQEIIRLADLHIGHGKYNVGKVIGLAEEIERHGFTKGVQAERSYTGRVASIDEQRLSFIIDKRAQWYPDGARDGSGRGILCYDEPGPNGLERAEAVGDSMRQAIDAARKALGEC